MAVTQAIVDTAIEEVLTKGQTSTLGAMSKQRANLTALQQESERQAAKTARASLGGRPTFRAFNFTGMGY